MFPPSVFAIAAGYTALVFGILLRGIVREITCERTIRYSFFITDIWAVMLGVSPTLWAASQIVKVPVELKASFCMGIAAVTACQIVGAFFARILMSPKNALEKMERLRTALHVIVGAFCGYGIAAVLAGLFFVFGLCVAICMAMVPMATVILVTLLVYLLGFVFGNWGGAAKRIPKERP